MKRVLTLALILSALACPAKKGPAAFVDPYIGSGGHGHVFVGASVPFGAIQVGPQNIFKGWDWCSGYHYSDSVMIGFSHTHLSGTGCCDLGDVVLMPFMGEVRTRRGEQNDITGSTSSYYSHKTEKVEPGYYGITLDNGVGVELTASCRTAFHRYSFPKGEKHLLIDLHECNGSTTVASAITLEDPYTITGYKIVHGWAPEHRVYFAIRSHEPIAELLVYENDAPKGRGSYEGVGVKGVVTFQGDPSKVALKVSISSVSEKNALENLDAEIPHWNFSKVRKAALQAWNDELSRVEISTKDARARRIFYTAMYHTMIAPTTYADVNGEFRGHDNVVRKATWHNYSTFSCWDTYRALHPWFTIIQKDKVGDMVNSMLSIYDQQGYLPVWPLVGGETNQMPGYGSVAIVSDAVVKGIEGIDAARALDAAVKTATNPAVPGISYLMERDYIPADKVHEATSKAMEYAISDWGIGAMARKAGKESLAKEYFRRGRLWKEYFDPSMRFVRPKFDDGHFLTPYNPFTSVHEVGWFAEGNGWQYSFLAPQDPYGLRDAMGGDKGFREKLDSLFSVTGDMGPLASADISGLIGQYAHGNEPSHHMIYLYNYAGQPWKTARLVAQVQRDFYTDGKDGVIGNEDCGQMSAWHVLSALGFFQVNPSCGVYSFGTPLFPKAVLHIPGGKTFTIQARGLSADNIYIQSVTLNGKAYDKSYIRYEDIVSGGKLVFTMGAQPNKEFGLAPESRPYNENDYRDPSLSAEERARDLVSRLTLEEKASLMVNHAAPIDELGVRRYDWWNEALHGVARNGSATTFPMPIGMAASFDDDLLYKVFCTVSDEGRIKHRQALAQGESHIYQGLTFWTPNINLFRDPRWGRGIETYGEDPYLTGRMGVAVVKGLQGDLDAPVLKAHACAKHLAVHSGPERLRHVFDAKVSERDLRETYLPAFKDLVQKGGVQEVMTAYTRIRGVPTGASKELVTKILREEWGYKGLVVSDCGSISDFYLPGHHEYVADAAMAAAAAVNNGVDLECGEVYVYIPEAVSRGLLEESAVDRSLIRLMTARYRLGEMDNAATEWDALPDTLVEGKAHRALALKMAQECMVLLKNDGVLPLKEGGRIALLGPNADDAEMQWGNYNPVPKTTVTLLQALREHCPDLVYLRATDLVGGTPDPSVMDAIEGIETVIFAGGISPRLEGEELPVQVEGFLGGDRTSLDLPEVQRTLLEKLHKAGKKVILVNFSGSAISMEPEKKTCNAILQAWYPGQEGGTAVADILYGNVNPSGKMPVTTYKNVDQIPAFEDYDMTGKTYRFLKTEPGFPFGYGLSYTTFNYGKPSVSGHSLKVSVTNTGSRDGAEVVQLYVRRPDDPEGPNRTLRGFKKVFIPAGKTVEVEISLTDDVFQWWDPAAQDMRLRPGRYELQVGGSSASEALQTLEYQKK